MLAFTKTKAIYQTKVIIIGLMFLGACLVLSGCTPKNHEKLDINDLSGKTIGVMLGYSSDYILTNDSTDVALRRYDSYSDMVLALAFHQLDALILESDEAYVFCRLNPNYMIYGSFADKIPYGYMLNPRRTELNEQFNSFVADFRKTGIFADIIKRAEASAEKPFVSKPVTSTGKDGKILRALVYDGWEPVSYLNTKTNQWEGTDIELITHFANSIGAKVEFTPNGSYTQGVLDLKLGKVDIFACPDSLVMKEDREKAGNVTMSDCVWEKGLVFIVNTADYH